MTLEKQLVIVETEKDKLKKIMDRYHKLNELCDEVLARIQQRQLKK